MGSIQTNETRRKMTGVERAKQFAPFSALKGLDDGMWQVEMIADEMWSKSNGNEDWMAELLKRMHR